MVGATVCAFVAATFQFIGFEMNMLYMGITLLCITIILHLFE
jgi:hypothetical protein